MSETLLEEKKMIFSDGTLIPISLVRSLVALIVGIGMLIAPWLTIMYYKTAQVDDLVQRMQMFEQLSVQTKARLDSMEPLVKETRDTVVKILTSQPYSSR